jgi:hypothetical protein
VAAAYGRPPPLCRPGAPGVPCHRVAAALQRCCCLFGAAAAAAMGPAGGCTGPRRGRVPCSGSGCVLGACGRTRRVHVPTLTTRGRALQSAGNASRAVDGLSHCPSTSVARCACMLLCATCGGGGGGCGTPGCGPSACVASGPLACKHVVVCVLANGSRVSSRGVCVSVPVRHRV